MSRLAQQKTWLFLFFFFLTGLLHFYENDPVEKFRNTIFFCLIFTIHISLLICWLETLYARLLPSRSRTYLIMAAGLMILFLILRTFRYRLILTEIPYRYSWYGYYIPLILIPTLFLMSSCCFLRQERYAREWLFFLPSCLLVLMVLTNDLHHMVFVPMEGAAEFNGNSGTYRYGPGYYVAVLWIGLTLCLGILFLVHATRRLSSLKKVILPAFFLLLILPAIWFRIILSQMGSRSFFELPEIFIFCILGSFESCIRSRLVPYNENYPGFFARMKAPAVIRDLAGKDCYRTEVPLRATEEELRRSLLAPVYPEPDTKLRGKALKSGYAFWEEDEKELHRLNRELTAANEVLDEENDLIRAENLLKERKARLDAERQVYDRIAEALYPVQKKVATLLEKEKPDSPSFRRTLAVCCVLNAYAKRKSNLLLLSEENLNRPNRELFLALQESARFLTCCGIEAAAVGESWSSFPLSMIHDHYDTFETLIETYLTEICRMTVSLTENGIRMAVEKREEEVPLPVVWPVKSLPELPETPLPVSCRESEGLVYLTVRAEKEESA